MRSNTIYQTLNNNENNVFDNINTLAIAKITKVDNKKMMCNIKLIDLPEIMGTKDEVEEIENVPILPLFWNSEIKANAMYKENDKVVVVFCQHSTFNARNSDEPVEADTTSRYDINNALVIAHITKDSEENKYPNDFYVLHNKTEFRISKEKVFLKSKDVDINMDNEITIKATKQKSNIKQIEHDGTSLKANFGGNVKINASDVSITASTITFNGNVKVNGNIDISGNENVGGVSNASNFVAGPVTLLTHKHTTTGLGTPTTPSIP